MEKTVTVDFWDVLDLGDNPFDLLPIIEAAGNAPLKVRMRKRGLAQQDFLALVTRDGNAIAGTAALIRIEDWPKEIDLGNGALAALELATSKALAEEMNFRFDGDLRVLATQRHRLFRTSRLTRLLQEITGSMFVLQPILREDAMQRFDHMNRIGKVSLKYRGPMSPQTAGAMQSVANVLDAARNDFQERVLLLNYRWDAQRNR